MRYFNTEGLCEPGEHYMVKLDDRLEKIKTLYVDKRKYFVINRGRQYGKTTTLMALAEYLKNSYIVLSMDFQMMSTASFESEQIFSQKFIHYVEQIFSDKKEFAYDIDTDSICRLSSLKKQKNLSLDLLFEGLSKICETAKKPIILIIDEVDSASNNQVFLDFLAQLRGYYLNRKNRPIFYSVILAGVYDIKNLKLKMRLGEEIRYNSPWNIAADFDIDMNFSVNQIAKMLEEYEIDNHTGMSVTETAEEIYQYTSGYPYLVSAICKIMDEKLPADKTFCDSRNIWTKKGVISAVKIILKSKSTLFDSMIKHINEYPDMKQIFYAILFQGEQVTYNLDNPMIELADMFGYIMNFHETVQIANRIFETRLYNLFLSEDELKSAISQKSKQDKNQFIVNGRLNMKKVLEKFVEYFNDIYGENDAKFIETYGRKFFLLYLKPIINGTGNYYIEAQTRDARRTDVIVDYAGEQFVIEMKIWHGNEYNERGEKQLCDYLNYFHQQKGYMLSFNFNKNKQIGIKTITFANKILVEAVV